MKKIACILLSVLFLSMHAFSAPSDWAKEEITAARQNYTMGFPVHFEETWQENTTRAEFAQMAIILLRLTLGYTENDLRAFTDGWENKVPTYADEEILSILPAVKTEKTTFTDTEDRSILLAADIGIVRGRGDGTFDPDGYITRQEAAVMLLRTYAAYSGSVSFASGLTFTDTEMIAPWARIGVRFALENDVMQGVEDNRFAPDAYYTHEQSVITFHRLTKLEGWKENPNVLAATWAIYESQRKEKAAIEAAKTMEDHLRDYKEAEHLVIDNEWETPYGVLLYMHTSGTPHTPTYEFVLCGKDNKTYGLSGPVPAIGGWGARPQVENMVFSEDGKSFTFEVHVKERVTHMLDAEKVLYEAGTYCFKTDLSVPETVLLRFVPKGA